MLLLSESRQITVSGSANAYGPDGESTYSLTQIPPFQFAPFVSETSSNASSFSPGTGPNGLDVSAMASSRAWQDSIISSSQLWVQAEVSSESSSLLPTWPGACHGEASSSFEVTFTVPFAQTYELTLDRFHFAHSFPAIDATCSLSPVGGNPILHLPLSQFSNGQTFTGNLEAGTVYTLNLFLNSVSTTPDPLGELGFLRAELKFTVVLEPSSLLLLGLALGGLTILRRR